MAVTIVRTSWIDDDGTGTTGTVINNAVKTALYNDIDGALAKVAQLTGGNTLTGNQTVSGVLSVTALGVHGFSGAGVGANELRVVNPAVGPGNSAQLSVGNDTSGTLTQLIALSSTYTPNVYLQPNSSALIGAGTGGLSLATNTPAPIKFWTNYGERVRITPTGEVLINAVANVAAGQLTVVSDQAHTGVVVQNTNPANGMTFAAYMNSAAGAAGTITQTGVATVSYNTASDARLKDDAGRAVDVSALRAVVVHDFAWTADGRSDRGVFAQEAHAVCPRAVTVGTDETTADGTLVHPWMTDYSKFVPDLIVGWQHHDADLAEIRALLTTLKGFSDGE